MMYKQRREEPAVLIAIRGGADTFGKIVKATGLDTTTIRKALNYYVYWLLITKTGRRYTA